MAVAYGLRGSLQILMTRIQQLLAFLLCKPRLRFQKLVECGFEIGLFHIGTGRFVQGTSRDALDPQLLVGVMEGRPDLARYRHRIRAANNHWIRVKTEPQSTGRLIHVQGAGTGMDRVQAHVDYYPFIIGGRICCCCCCRSTFGRRRKRPRNVLERIDHTKDQFTLLRQLLFINIIVSRWVVLDVSLGKERLALAVKDVKGMDTHGRSVAGACRMSMWEKVVTDSCLKT
jgi:hypothetical protein